MHTNDFALTKKLSCSYSKKINILHQVHLPIEKIFYIIEKIQLLKDIKEKEYWTNNIAFILDDNNE